VHDPDSWSVSLSSDDRDDYNAALHPGASICGSGDDPNSAVSCRPDGTKDTQNLRERSVLERSMRRRCRIRRTVTRTLERVRV
jgi:hypothetical protein